MSNDAQDELTEHIYEVCTYPERQADHETALGETLECPACGQVPT